MVFYFSALKRLSRFLLTYPQPRAVHEIINSKSIFRKKCADANIVCEYKWTHLRCTPSHMLMCRVCRQKGPLRTVLYLLAVSSGPYLRSTVSFTKPSLYRIFAVSSTISSTVSSYLQDTAHVQFTDHTRHGTHRSPLVSSQNHSTNDQGSFEAQKSHRRAAIHNPRQVSGLILYCI